MLNRKQAESRIKKNLMQKEKEYAKSRKENVKAQIKFARQSINEATKKGECFCRLQIIILQETFDYLTQKGFDVDVPKGANGYTTISWK